MAEKVKLIAKTPETKKGNLSSKTQKPDFSQSTGSPIDQILFLQRTIGNQAVLRMLNNSAESEDQSAKSREQRAGNEVHGVQSKRLCAKRLAPCTVQAKLKIGQPNDVYEQEADRVAEQVMRMAVNEAKPVANTLNPPNTVHRKCDACEEEEEPVQRKALPSGGGITAQSPAHVREAIGSGDSPLDRQTRSFFEPHLGYDLSSIRIHTGGTAAESAKAIDAKAYTLGSDIVFGDGEYQPETDFGKQILAHELTHVRQGGKVIRRCANPGVNDPKYDALAIKLKSHAKYTTLADKTKADEVLVEAKKKPACLYLLGKFQTLLDTPEKGPATITVETQASTATAVTAEKARVAKPAHAKNLKIEETASADPKRKWVKIAGKFGGGKYEVDRTNPKNIAIRVKVFLKVAGTGTLTDVQSVKQMEDGIEKAASAKGFIVDIEFVSMPGSDAFEVDVSPGEWETATNWSGGEPLGFAHELFHLMYYEVDRYDYIAAHSTNQSMMIPDRIAWFLAQLKKPAGWDNPASIMAGGSHPLDDDICRVAGLPEADCIKERKKP